MEQLIKVSENEKGEQLVSSRDLYDFLQPSTRFDKWIQRMLEYDFAENQDYVVTVIFGRNSNGGKQSFTDYILTLDTAKEISMLQRTDKGKQARQYFIACEKKLKEVVSDKPISTLDMVELMLRQARQQEARLAAVEDKVLQIEAQTATRPDYLTIMGYAVISRVKVSLSLAAQLGKKAKAICSQNGYHVDQIHDPRFGLVNVYPSDVLKRVFDTTFA